MSQANKYKRLVSDIFIFIMGTVLTKAVQFLLMPLYTTYMTTQAYGMAELTNNMSELLFPIVTLCIYEAAFRFVIGSEFNSSSVFTSAVKLLTGSALLGVGVIFAIKAVTGYEYAWYLYFILYAFSFRMLMAYYAKGKGYSKLFAASGVLNAVFLAGFTYVFLVIAKLDVSGYLLAIALSYTGSCLFLFLGGRLYKDISLKAAADGTLSKMLSYSLPLIIYNVGYWLTTMSGRYILLYSKGASQAGVYAAVIKLAAVINMFQQAFYSAFQVNTAREYESAEKEAYYSKIFKLYSAAILVSGSMIIAACPIIAKLTLKGEFYSARIYLPIVLLVAIIDCLFCFYKTMYTTFKLTKRAVPSMLIGAAVNVVVAFATVEKYGILGICIASLCCYVSQAVYRIFDVRKFVNIKCSWPALIASLGIITAQAVLLSTDVRSGAAISVAGVALVLTVQLLVVRDDLKAAAGKVVKKRGSI